MENGERLLRGLFPHKAAFPNIFPYWRQSNMNIYGKYRHQVMTAEICGFQIHGFDGDTTVLNAYFSDLGIETGTFLPCGRRSPRGSVIAHDPYRKMHNDYPGHDISCHEDFASYTELLELDSEYSELPAFLAKLQSDEHPCFLFYNHYEENDSWNCAFSKAVFFLIRHNWVHAIDLLKPYSPSLQENSRLSGGIPDEHLAANGISFLNLQRFVHAGKEQWFFTRLTPLAYPGLHTQLY